MIFKFWGYHINKSDIKRLKKENEDLKKKLKKTREDFEEVSKKLNEEGARFRSALNDAISQNMKLVEELNNLKIVTERLSKLGFIGDEFNE